MRSPFGQSGDAVTNLAALDWQACRVVETVPVSDRARRITLERPEPTGRPAEPGSHVDVRIRLDGNTDVAADVRSYSVVESDPTGQRLTLTVLLADPGRGGSAYLHRLRVGEVIEATRPIQDFPLVLGADRYLLLAGGIGITALVATARTLSRYGTDYRLVYVGRSRGAMPYLDDLAAEHGDQLELHVNDEDTPLDVVELVNGLAGTPGRPELMMCGPVRLLDDVRRAWAAAGLSAADLRYETFANSGWYDAELFEVTVPELDITTTVSPQQTMLDALTAAGAELMWDCRKGECGLCEMAVTRLDGRLDHRDVFLSDREKAEGRRLCVCVARVIGADRSAPARVTLAFG